MKTFKGDFFKLLNKLRNGEHFSFTRYSDGEMFVMQKKKLVLAQNHVQIGDETLNFGYNEEDHKDFDPEKHEKMADHLIKTYAGERGFKDCYKGISCRCCVGNDNFNWFYDLYYSGATEAKTKKMWDGNLTWSNLFVNSNYPLFVNHFIPEFKNHDIIIVCNENADLDGLPFASRIKKDFRIGSNALVENYDLVEEIRDYHIGNNINNHVYLLAASSLSNIIAYELNSEDGIDNFSDWYHNWYIDVGSTLNKHMKMDIARDYLKGYWQGAMHPDLFKECIW